MRMSLGLGCMSLNITSMHAAASYRQLPTKNVARWTTMQPDDKTLYLAIADALAI
jgi:hypothetical protein